MSSYGLMYKYNLKYVPNAFGLQNTGSICYFNSLIQSLISCSSFNEHILANQDKYGSNPIINNYIKLLQGSLGENSTKRSNWRTAHVQMLQLLIKMQQKSTFKIKFGSGQQDAEESLNLLLDAIKDESMIELFQVRYSEYILCYGCKKRHRTASHPCLPIDIPLNIFDGKTPSEHATIIKQYICQRDEQLDKLYVCQNSKCGVIGNNTKYSTLTMTPEIIVILFKKYINTTVKMGNNTTTTTKAVKTCVQFPLEFSFNNGKLRYQIVSQCEHSGGLDGGHYWAISRRKNGIYNLNDSSISTNLCFKPTANTYLVFYHVL